LKILWQQKVSLQLKTPGLNIMKILNKPNLEKTYIRCSKGLNSHILGILVATTSGAALNIGTGNVSNYFHLIAIFSCVIATAITIKLFIDRTNIDESIDRDKEPRTPEENFIYYCRHDDRNVRNRFFSLLISLIILFFLIIGCIYIGAREADQESKEAQSKIVNDIIFAVKAEVSKQQVVIDSQSVAILRLKKALKKQDLLKKKWKAKQLIKTLKN
jgi:hypothetical protein